MVTKSEKTGVWATVSKHVKIVYLKEFQLVKLVNTKTQQIISQENCCFLTANQWQEKVFETRKKLQNEKSN